MSDDVENIDGTIDATFEIGETNDVDATFELGDNAPLDALFEINAANGDHRLLEYRDAPDQHPIAAITDLQNTLDQMSEVDAGLRRDLSQEISDRTNADTDLGQRITAEKNRAEGAESALGQRITDETNRAEGVESNLSQRITNEQTRAESAESTLRTNLSNHTSNKNNPHQVTKEQVGLGNVDNTSDLNKPISTATQNALNLKADKSEISRVGYSNNYNDLDNRPTIGNATLTINRNNTKVGDFTANATSNKTINITVPTKASDVGALPNTTTINDLTTTTQQNALNSGITSASVAQITTNKNDITTINSKIPTQATSTNQLADKDFVNSSINSMAAFYITSDAEGDPFDTKAALVAGPWYNQGQLRTPTNNDYALVTEDETHDDKTSRYLYDGTQWIWQYTLNNTTFTQAQIDAINSGITSTLVTQIGTNESNITSLQNNKQDNLSQGDGITITNNTVINSGVRSVSTGQNNGTISVNTNGSSSEVSVAGLGSAAYTSSDTYATSAQGSLADSALQPSDVTSTYDASGTAPVNGQAVASAISGKQNTITGAATTITSNDLTANKALVSDANGKVAASGVTNTELGYLSGVSSAIQTQLDNKADTSQLPTVNDATLTIKQNGTDVETFSANSSTNKTANIIVPTKTSDLNNDSGFITSDALSGYATQQWVVGQGYLTGITSSMVTTALGFTPIQMSDATFTIYRGE